MTAMNADRKVRALVVAPALVVAGVLVGPASLLSIVAPVAAVAAVMLGIAAAGIGAATGGSEHRGGDQPTGRRATTSASRASTGWP
ncbi:MAG: hypothetical protein ABI903_16295 [Actinomycetota bacterium]